MLQYMRFNTEIRRMFHLRPQFSGSTKVSNKGWGSRKEHLVSAKVTFLEDNEDLRILVSRILKAKFDLDCTCVSSIHDLIEEFEDVLASDLVILDINLGTKESGMDAYRWLRDQGFKGKVFFLTGYDQSNPIVSLAQEEGVEVYQKPLGTHKLLSLVSNALNIH